MVQEDHVFQDYMHARKALYAVYMPDMIEKNMLSETNWLIRGRADSGKALGIYVKAGDIAYLDYGQSYLNEMGYQHFGLVMTVCHCKALVIPLSSNAKHYRDAYDPKDNPHGQRNLMRLGRVPGLRKASMLYLNDARYINTARIIKVMAHIPPEGELFRSIQKNMIAMMVQ